ncbi:MAG: hypothetical protein HY897_17840 [Deltaproteobacteria bacterium]|nr:hypothetical protein [Deltaproteobacteria bacterium]
MKRHEQNAGGAWNLIAECRSGCHGQPQVARVRRPGIPHGQALLVRGTRKHRGFLFALATVHCALFTLLACDTDLAISDFKYACESDNECGAGHKCEPGVGCVKFPESKDAGRGDAGGGRDAGAADGGTDAGTDAGADAGTADGGFMLRYSSTSDSAAGAGTSDKYMLKSVTGWSTGPKWNVGNYELKMGSPFEQGKK